VKNRLIELQIGILEDIVRLANKTCDLIDEMDEEKIEVSKLPSFHIDTPMAHMQAFNSFDEAIKSPAVKLSSLKRMKIQGNDGAKRGRPKKAQA
jgi:hypothetical protein